MNDPHQIAAEAAKDFCLRFYLNPDVFLEPLTEAFKAAIEKAKKQWIANLSGEPADAREPIVAHASEHGIDFDTPHKWPAPENEAYWTNIQIADKLPPK